jgi:putative Mg2+ transporter-C (MgtC) family protein
VSTARLLAAEPDAVVIAGRACCALALGALVGLDRELNGQPAGMRTHAMVAVGSALFALAGDAVTGTDPTRIAAQVVSGIGFIGAGAIMRDSGRVRGLTTAASLWATAAVGLAAGFGQLLMAALFTLASLVVLVMLKRAPLGWLSRRGLTAVVTVGGDAPLGRVRQELHNLAGARATAVRTMDDGRHRLSVVIDNRAGDPLDTADQLLAVSGVVAVEVR